MASRGDIVVVDFAVAGMPKKVRPVLIVQADSYNSKMANTIVAMITTNLARAGERTHLLIDISTPEGKLSGLLHKSVINCNTLTTVRQDDILRTLGSFLRLLCSKLINVSKRRLLFPDSMLARQKRER